MWRSSWGSSRKYAQVLAENEVAAHIGNEAYEYHAREDGYGYEAVEAVGKVGPVSRCGNHERHEADKNPVGQVQLENIDGEEGNREVALEFGDELVADDGDDFFFLSE